MSIKEVIKSMTSIEQNGERIYVANLNKFVEYAHN